MNKRSLFQAAFILASFPLAACGGGDDDSGTGGNSEPSQWADHTYVLTTGWTNWTTPGGIGKDIENVMPSFMFQMTTKSGKDMTARIGTALKTRDYANGCAKATGMHAAQDMCSPTFEVPVSGANYPASHVGPVDAQLHLLYDGCTADATDDVQVTAKVSGLEFINVLPDGDLTLADDNSVLNATMDVTEIAPLFTALGMPGMPPTAQTVCDELAKNTSDHTGCKPCPGTGTPTCLTAQATSIEALPETVAVQPVDINSRPATCKNTY